MKNILLFYVLISFLSFTIYTQGCLGSKSNNLIQAGTIKINTNDLFGKTRQYFYQVQIQYKIPTSGFQTALSLASFNSFNTSLGLNFLIRGQRIQSTNALGISAVVIQRNTFSNIQISYFVSSRTDIWVGSFTQNLIFFNQQSNSNAVANKTVSNCICDWIAGNNFSSNYTAYVFISSIISGIDNFKISLGNTVFDKVKGKITTTLINTSTRIQLITLSYIVITNPNQQFTYTFFRGPNVLDTNVEYKFKGVTQILQGKIDNNKNSFITLQSKELICSGNCSSGCIIKTECQKIKTNIIFNKTCFICPSNSKFDQKSKTCAVTCSANEQNINSVCQCKDGFVRVGTQCINRCRINEIWTSNSCKCIKGHARIFDVCVKCPDNSQPSINADTCFCQRGFQFDKDLIKCIPITCPSGFKFDLTANSCISICKVNEVFNPSGNNCLCKQNFFRINSVCAQCPANQGYRASLGSCVVCGLNQISQNSICRCRQGTNLINGVCNSCPSGTVYNPSTSSCKSTCLSNQILSNGVCVCIPGFSRINKICGQCPSNTFYDEALQKCSPRPVCPNRSEWDSKKLSCICSVAGQNLIDGVCKPCGANAGWNGVSCVCRSQFFLINNQCAKCPINSAYSSNSRTCVCNRGFYLNQNQCQKCDSTCGTCSGPSPKNCIDCVDVSYKLINGQCTKNSPCVQGKYFSNNVCNNCSVFCKSCQNQNKCLSCINGFVVSKVPVTQTLTLQFCQQICGDGIRFQQVCDDGNTNNGDGCSSSCFVQSGWTCSGGSTTTKTNCIKAILPAQIVKKGAVLGTQKILQGVRILNLPAALTEGGCPNCSEILKVSVIKTQIIPVVKTVYVPTTQFQYLIQFNFNGIFSIPPFTFSMRINEKFSKFFTKQEMAQQIIVTIDSALLARRQQITQLTFEQISTDSINYTQNDLNDIFNQ